MLMHEGSLTSFEVRVMACPYALLGPDQALDGAAL